MPWVQFSIFGVMAGAVYGLLALGLVLVWRTSRVLNFAHTAVATAATYIYYALTQLGLPVVVALVLGLAAGAALNTVAYALVFRRAIDSSVVVKILLALGVAAVITGTVELAGGATDLRVPMLMPDRSISILGAGVSVQQLMVLASLVASSAGLWWMLRRTRFGLYLRAVSSNRDSARLAGINDSAVSMGAWALAGALAALAGILIIPINLLLSPLVMAPFLVSSFAAAVVGALVNPFLAVAGAMAIGVSENLILGAPAPVDELGPMVAFAAIAGYLVWRWRWLQALSGVRHEARATFEDRDVGGAHDAPELAPAGTLAVSGIFVSVLLLVPLLGGFWSFIFLLFLIYALMGQAIVFTTGFMEQISLMPATFVGIGAFSMFAFGHYFGYPAPLAIIAASLVTVPVAVVVGVPALRLRGPFLALGTLAFAGLIERTLFRWDWFSGGFSGVTVARPQSGALSLDDDRWFYYMVLGCTIVTMALLRNISRGRAGRSLRAVRDNESAAQAMGLNPVRWRLAAFALSGFVAGMSGALFGYALKTYSSASFGFGLSLTLFGMVVLGGLRSIWGPVVGAAGLVLINELLRGYTFVNAVSLLVFGLVQIQVMLTSGEGLTGQNRELLAVVSKGLKRTRWLSFAFATSR